MVVFSGCLLTTAMRPDSSVVEHFHGKEGVASSILARGSDLLIAHTANLVAE